MRGFMCQSVELTSGCTIPDARDVIVPKRVLGKNGGALKRLIEIKIEIEKSRLGDRKRLIANGSMETVLRTAPPPAANPSDNVFQASGGGDEKVKKHLSEMEDLEEKQVTVRGHVSPARVLESISKVKRAEFWTPF